MHVWISVGRETHWL